MSEGPTGYAAYSHTGWGAEHGESDKRSSWDKAIERREELSAGGVEFVPFSIEAGGVWGPAARKFFRECVALADDDRDIDLYHWSSTRFSRAWILSLCWWLEVAPKSVLQPQLPTGRSGFETCSTWTSMTPIEESYRFHVLMYAGSIGEL